VVFAFDAIGTQKKTCQVIIDSGNHCIGALKGSQSRFVRTSAENFIPLERVKDICKGMVGIEKITLSICRTRDGIREWPGLKTAIRVDSERQTIKAQVIQLLWNSGTTSHR